MHAGRFSFLSHLHLFFSPAGVRASMFSAPPGCVTGESIMLLCLFLRGPAPDRSITPPLMPNLAAIAIHVPRGPLIDPRISKRDCDTAPEKVEGLEL